MVVTRRKDNAGKLWTEDEVASEVIAIVRDLSPGVSTEKITLRSSLAKLGWDSWYRLRLIKPVEKRLHERLEAQLLIDRARTVADVKQMVWAMMEDA